MYFKFIFSIVVLTTFSEANSSVHRYYNARVVLNHEIKNAELWTKDGKIIGPQAKADESFDIKGMIIAPGYIDLQINGAFGVDLSQNPEQVQKIAKQLPQYGVTAFLPTLVSLDKAQYASAIPHLQPMAGGSQGASILGIHLEGPFFSAKQSGAHNPDMIRNSTDLEDIYGTLNGVKIVTLAPELPGMGKAIMSLKDKGIVISAGHTSANYDELKTAKQQGVQLATHLFNAMPPLHHRNPGIVGAVLQDPEMFYSVIADGIHLHETTVNLAWKTNPQGFVLVTDAIQALGLPDGEFTLGSMTVDVKKGGAYLKGTNTIAGSVLSMDKAVRNFKKFTQCTIPEAIDAASYKPAKILGIEKSKGTLNPGADADFIILNDDLEVQSSYVNGVRVWTKG